MSAAHTAPLSESDRRILQNRMHRVIILRGITLLLIIVLILLTLGMRAAAPGERVMWWLYAQYPVLLGFFTALQWQRIRISQDLQANQKELTPTSIKEKFWRRGQGRFVLGTHTYRLYNPDAYETFEKGNSVIAGVTPKSRTLVSIELRI